MKRVTYILYNYPQLSETYVSSELTRIASDHVVDIISLERSNERIDDEQPYVFERDEAKIVERTRAFAPDVIHTHWLWGPQLMYACRLARTLDRPLTVRGHSFDVLALKPADPYPSIARNLDILCGEQCLGILSFPFGIPRLIEAGLPEHKLIPCRPVVDYERFHDESPNGQGVVNVGACLPKKDFRGYLDLAMQVRELNFDLYPIGPQTDALRKVNEELGSPVTIHSPVRHSTMRGVYKQHEWLVYTADRNLNTVGWPVSIGEAQACGAGICMPNLRPDVKDLVGPGGFIYDSLDEVREIIRQPYPESMRRAGFEHARRSDVREHLPLLTNLWHQA
jgi:hypothetical protein